MTDGELLAEPNRIGQYRQIDPSQIDYDMIRKWIAHCRGTHGKPCQMLTAKPLRIAKFRLLDCKTETVVDCTELSQYVALSYVLGPSPNVNDKHQDLLSNAVIKDAMRVKFQLGLQYIWVDQLCIDQRDAEDMSCQLSQMNTIYNQVSVTIVAAAGDSSSYGLPGVGQRPRTIPNKFTLNGTTWKFRPELIKHQVGRSKWSTRGWTYQEAVFSRRCVIFADDQVFFQCGCMMCAEELIKNFANCELDFPIFEQMADEDSDSQPYLPRGGRFMQDLKAYSKRELTYDFDVLRAMDGVFGFYAQLEPSVEQYWGLPLRWVGCVISSEYYRTARLKHDDVVGAFLWAMLWKPAWSEVQSTKTGSAKRSGFPTWSWSGWKVEVTWSYLKNTKHLEKSFTVPLFVETATGGLVEFNKDFARSLASGQSYTTLGLTHILTITTEVFDVPFIECAPYRHTPTLKRRDSFAIRYKGQHWVKKDEYPYEDNWTHFVVQKNIGASNRGLVWYLDLTNGGATGSSDLVFDTGIINLNLMRLRCIVIGYDRGMVVQSSNGISRRVGLLTFEGEFFENGRVRSNEYGYHNDDVSWPWTDSVHSRDLRDHFTSVVQTVRLG
ncbi:heterokaryon incompatibility protein-domain-containing protein [Fusarium avenaceum]|nr:heterokaryon incompatibility protein-domain-containing protein [Fusarium avenaceum]